ncbi:alpha-ketoglutarate-dependent dioxygenase alkB homolog 7, mitochondrial [Hirundo rustica]|uniref:alpha-ketoglutarate-dependent dioxygenase alkB homolog 7, mitochondrial n=1 Tax=Hirundo rustica TaxID=43150 RepID=UPI001A93F503|nr:alpha-ketoglutarate-dependent dioxygenase alkB homolog 7, mitochondrial [Hirundo rustica]
MHRARGLWRAGVPAALGGSRALSARAELGSRNAELALGPEAEADPALLRASSPELSRRLRGLALVRGRFVSDGEAAELLREVEPGLGRARYQNDHWDRAITGYRETERSLRGSAGRALLLRLSPAFPPRRPPRACAHVLDLLPGGRVGPHVDSVKFCGCTIAGVSLLSPSVLRLRSLRDPREWLELLLEPGSLYVLRGAARYEFTHEILPDEESFFGELRVPRGRRVALIFRNDPPETPPQPLCDLPAFIEDPAPPK